MEEIDNWPPSPEEFLASLDTYKPLACIYNCISWSINPKRQVDESGYVECASVKLAEKILTIGECWKRLITILLIIGRKP